MFVTKLLYLKDDGACFYFLPLPPVFYTCTIQELNIITFNLSLVNTQKIKQSKKIFPENGKSLTFNYSKIQKLAISKIF